MHDVNNFGEKFANDVRFETQWRYLLLTWGYPMKQRQLDLRLKNRAGRPRRTGHQRNQPLADWWFRRIHATLEAGADDEPPSGPSPRQCQATFRWR